jgi:hypothetical protein
MLLEERVHRRLEEFVVTARAIVPVKLFNGPIVIVELPAMPMLSFTTVGLAEIEKS